MLNPWSFGHLTTGNTSIPDTPYFNTGDFTENSKRWCDAVAELYRQLYARGHNNVKYLVLFTEPIYAHEENIELQYDQYVENAKRLHNVLSATGLRRRITVMGPNRSDADTRLLKQLSAEADEAIDIYSQHQYLSAADLTADTYSDFALEHWGFLTQEVRSSGITKPFWVDEWNIQDYSKTKAGYSNVGFDDPMRGVQQAVGIITGMNLGIDNMMLWALADQQWPNQRNTGLSSGFYDGVSKHGLFNNIQITMTPKAQYYSYSLLSKYTGRGGGTTYAGVPENEYYGIYIGCVKTSDGDWTIIAVNNNIEDARLTVDIEASLGGVKLFRHQYVANEVQANIAAQIIPANKTFQNVTTAFTDIRFSDTIAHGSYIIDIHDPCGKRMAIGGQVKKNYYSIPYRCLVTSKAPNLATAGRSISADHVATSSTRIQGTAMLTGQAAGTAAAIAAETGCALPEVNVADLQKRLTDAGVFLRTSRDAED